MTDNWIEKKIAEAVEKNTPDILDGLLEDLDRADEALNTGRPEEKVWEAVRASDDSNAKAMSGTTKSTGLKRTLIGLAAVFVLMIGGLSVFRAATETLAVVGIDVNPSIELSINRNEKVTDVKAINADGEAILKDMDLKGTTLNTACNAITGAMLTKGYLTDTSNSILVSVRSADTARGQEIEKDLSEELNTYLGGSAVNTSILGQYFDDNDDEIEAFAEAHDISEGKAWLIKSLLASGSTKMTEDSLLKLSTQELILLGQERKVSNASSYGASDTSKYIGNEKALSAALAEAGISKDKASDISVEYDTDDGRIVYEVEFKSGGKEYEYDVDAVNGKIITHKGQGSDEDDDRDDDRDDIDDDDDDDRDDIDDENDDDRDDIDDDDDDDDD